MHFNVRLTTPSVECVISNESKKSGAEEKLTTDPPLVYTCNP